MIELIYTSRSPERLSDADIAQILETSRRNNIAQEVTGMLCYDGRRFIQILEGKSDVVMDLYARIYTDPRHQQIELLHDGPISERSFSDWRMAYEYLPGGLLEPLSQKMCLISINDAKREISERESSFGARLFGIFMESGLKDNNLTKVQA